MSHEIIQQADPQTPEPMIHRARVDPRRVEDAVLYFDRHAMIPLIYLGGAIGLVASQALNIASPVVGLFVGLAISFLGAVIVDAKRES